MGMVMMIMVQGMIVAMIVMAVCMFVIADMDMVTGFSRLAEHSAAFR